MDQRSVTVQCTHSRSHIGLLHSDRYRPTEQGWKNLFWKKFLGFRFIGFLKRIFWGFLDFSVGLQGQLDKNLRYRKNILDQPFSLSLCFLQIVTKPTNFD